MKKVYRMPKLKEMGRLVYKTKGSDSNYTNDAGGRPNGSKPNTNQ